MTVTSVIAQLLEIRDRASSLSSLEPGKGYDELGFLLSGIVMHSDFNPQQIEILLRELNETDKTALADLQSISVQSEMALEKYHAERIVNDLKKNKGTHLMTRAALDQALSSYPYNWHGPRVLEEIRLLGTCLDKSALTQGKIILMGRSMLPFSALALHVETGLRVEWLDLYEESASTAKEFIEVLVAQNLLDEAAIHIRHVKHPDDLSQFLLPDVRILYILDDEWIQPFLYDIAAQKKLPVLRVEPRGLACLMYPHYQSLAKEVPGFVRLTAVQAYLAREENESARFKFIAQADGMFISLALHQPV